MVSQPTPSIDLEKSLASVTPCVTSDATKRVERQILLQRVVDLRKDIERFNNSLLEQPISMLSVLEVIRTIIKLIFLIFAMAVCFVLLFAASLAAIFLFIGLCYDLFVLVNNIIDVPIKLVESVRDLQVSQ
ncbi:hypothetical protein BKA61DRAFT_683921 [Leptodontidium sp. MPI-SDFR-AT-0119]|nr:hypothetical protein BKA61DRAFT_683921 [Leptodontidium sp. MPI-SDFR-AT-0119]